MKILSPTSHQFLHGISSVLSAPQPLITLLGRLYVAWVFWASGLTKINDFESTLFLFEYEYQVPLLPFTLAAYLATFAEIVFPIMLSVGFASRISALTLSVVNVVAVISLEEIAPAALNQHLLWGVILLHVVVWGADRFSLDHWLKLGVSASTQSL